MRKTARIKKFYFNRNCFETSKIETIRLVLLHDEKYMGVYLFAPLFVYEIYMNERGYMQILLLNYPAVAIGFLFQSYIIYRNKGTRTPQKLLFLAAE